MNTLQISLNNVCKKYPNIAIAYLFGSYATDEQTPMSDIDIAVYLNNPSDFDFNKLLLLHGDCRRALRQNDFDVLVLKTTKNILLLKEIISTGKIIYNTNQKLLDDFEIRTLHAVHNFKERNRWEKRP